MDLVFVTGGLMASIVLGVLIVAPLMRGFVSLHKAK